MMSTFKYIGIESSGKRIEGKLTCAAISDAKNELRKQGLRVVQLQQVKSKKKNNSNTFISGLLAPTVKQETLIRFFRQLATMLNAGIQLLEAIRVLELQSRTHDKYFANALHDISKLVESGVPFSLALKEYNKIFSGMIISMIQAAEVGGGLGIIIDHIAMFIEKELDTKKKIKSATNYPKFVGGFFLLILTGIVFGLLPMFKDIFADFGAELPTPTKIILSVSDFIKSNVIIIGISSMTMFITLKIYAKSVTGRLAIDRFYFKMPIVSGFYNKSVLIRFTITLSILIKSGVDLIKSLNIAALTTDNTYIITITETISERITDGDSFSHLLTNYPEVFPPLESSMIMVGEKSGSLSLMLDKVAEFNEQEFSNKVSGLSSVLEPAIMGFLGIVATILVLGLYLPIFQMSGAVH